MRLGHDETAVLQMGIAETVRLVLSMYTSVCWLASSYAWYFFVSLDSSASCLLCVSIQATYTHGGVRRSDL